MTNYVHYINFIKQPKRIAAFLGSKEVDAILLELSAQLRNANFVPGQTCSSLMRYRTVPMLARP